MDFKPNTTPLRDEKIMLITQEIKMYRKHVVPTEKKVQNAS
jgi:hypothetical protein